MKKTIFISLILTSLFIWLFFIRKNPCVNSQAKIYQIENKKYCLLTADNQQEWEKGLMFYKKPVNFDGMMFIFPESDYRQFWNENTYLDLNVYWIDNDKVIGKSFLPSILKSKEIVVVESTGEVNKVAEIIK